MCAPAHHLGAASNQPFNSLKLNGSMQSQSQTTSQNPYRDKRLQIAYVTRVCLSTILYIMHAHTHNIRTIVVIYRPAAQGTFVINLNTCVFFITITSQ